MGKIKKLIKKVTPSFIVNVYSKYASARYLKKEARMIADAPYFHKIALNKVKEKNGPINVVFFALMESVWKYDILYKIMHANPRFNPMILVCPVVNYGKDNMLSILNQCYNAFKQKGYNVLMAYNQNNNTYIDVRTELNPDIIFYTNPYRGLIDDRYYIEMFSDILTCYVSYFFNLNKSIDFIDTFLQNTCWHNYLETKFHKERTKYIRNHGRNSVLTGYPGIDKFIDSNYIPSDVWKIKDRKIKRIIWAPHHTIDDYNLIQFGTFLSFCDFIIALTERYHNFIQIAFKPHPLLINRLYLKWGKEKTNAYYQKWKDLDNGMLCDGAYEDLFLTSDAIMHDSGSFLLEYLMTGKPAMHLDNGLPYEDQYNELAIEALEHYYHASTESEIEAFINQIIKGSDPKEQKRKEFVMENLLPPNGKLASQNIFNDLVKSLELKDL